ncbi:hypothetical protein [Aneurinibacillus aneurinilyticus]|uniref:hypothetical protein n=1 Tax=Aneurinibacillus aneurinilyticus TaxID=1391 RepID=UPI00352413E7
MNRTLKKLSKYMLCLSLILLTVIFNMTEAQAATTERYKFYTHAWSLPANSTATLFSVTAPVGEAFVAASGTPKDPNWPEYSSAASSILLQRTAPIEDYPTGIPYTIYGMKMDGTRINLKNAVANYSQDYNGGKSGWSIDYYQLGELPPIVSINIEITNTSKKGLNFGIPDDVVNSGRGSTYYKYITLTRESKAVLAPGEYAKEAAKKAGEAKEAAEQARDAAREASQNASV